MIQTLSQTALVLAAAHCVDAGLLLALVSVLPGASVWRPAPCAVCLFCSPCCAVSACLHEHHREKASKSLSWSAFQGACAAGHVVLARAMFDGPGFGTMGLHYRGEVRGVMTGANDV